MEAASKSLQDLRHYPHPTLTILSLWELLSHHFYDHDFKRSVSFDFRAFERCFETKLCVKVLKETTSTIFDTVF